LEHCGVVLILRPAFYLQTIVLILFIFILLKI